MVDEPNGTNGGKRIIRAMVAGLALVFLGAIIGADIRGWNIEARLDAVEKDLQWAREQADLLDGAIKDLDK
jgi:hypothetical protein